MMETPRDPKQDAIAAMDAAIETIRYTIRAQYYDLNNPVAQRVRRIGEELKLAINDLKKDYHDRYTPRR